MKRIAFAEGFQRLVGRGLTRDAALFDVLDEERASGRLRVWCNGRPMRRSEVRGDLRFRFDPNDANKPPVVLPAGPIGWKVTYTFELDAAQIKALIAGLTKKRKRKPKSAPQRPRGRPDHPLKQKILDDARQRIARGETAKLAANLHADYLKKGGPLSERTIRDWLAEMVENKSA